MKTLKEIAKDYYAATKPLSKRISELQKDMADIELSRAKFAAASRNIKNRAKLEEIEEHLRDYDGKITIIKGRIRVLTTMRGDLVDVAREVNHYYDLWWYRSPDYSMNQRKGQKFVYFEGIF